MDQHVCIAKFANVLSVLSLDILGGENKMRHASDTNYEEFSFGYCQQRCR